MKGLVLSLFGLLFGCAAAWFFVAAFTMETTVPSTAAPDGFQGISNLQLMHIQMLDIVLGGSAAIVSAILFAGGSIVRTIAEAAQRPSAEST